MWRTIHEIQGFHLQASDGKIGHVKDFIVSDQNWGIRFLVVDLREWIPGEKILISPQKVQRIHWDDKMVEVSMTCDEIRNSPPYDPAKLINREYETTLYER